MKKMKLFLMAALLVGAGSAFTTVKPTKVFDAHATLNGGVTWIDVNRSDEGSLFDCNAGTGACLYNSESTSDPIDGYENKEYVPKTK